MKHVSWQLNTSNSGKFEEFKLLFAKYDSALETSHLDLNEIDADPIKVVAHKASQLKEKVIVDDTSLDIDGVNVGINIRWLLNHFKEFVGRNAEWIVLLAFRQDNQIYIYKGSVPGIIVQPKGEKGFGFDRFFLPNGAKVTLAESKTDVFNARAKAVDALFKGDIFAKHPIIKNWTGPWQKS